MMSEIIRNKVQEIKRKNQSENFMVYEITSDGSLQITLGRNGIRNIWIFHSKIKDIYLSAIEEIQQIDYVSKLLNLPSQEVVKILEDLHMNGLILFSRDRKSFLSLATNISHNN